MASDAPPERLPIDPKLSTLLTIDGEFDISRGFAGIGVFHGLESE